MNPRHHDASVVIGALCGLALVLLAILAALWQPRDAPYCANGLPKVYDGNGEWRECERKVSGPRRGQIAGDEERG
jgi:hypothetical protein